MFRRVKILLFSMVLSLGIVTFNTTNVLAEDAGQQKYYIGLKAPYIWIDGDFDGLDENLGGGLVFGATEDLYTCEISYCRSEHDILNIYTADFESLNLSVKICPKRFLNKHSRPYGLIGWGFSKITFENVKYQGDGFHLGFGINCRINKKIAIDGSVGYYRYSIDTIKDGELDYEPPRDDWEMINTVISLGVQYCF